MSRRPHIVFILTDQQRYDSLGCNGHRFAVTPNLDLLASESVVFDRCLTPNSVCMPSRASILTGLYPSAHGVWQNGCFLARACYVPWLSDEQMIGADHPARGTHPSNIPTFADLLGQAGYRTAAAGKLHLTPTQAHPALGFEESVQRWRDDASMAEWQGPYFGFDEVHLTLGHGEMIDGHYGRWLRTRHPGQDEARMRAAAGPRPFAEVSQLYVGGLDIECHPTTWIADRACEVIRRQESDDRPLLLWVGIPDPHHPFSPPAELAREFETHATAGVCAADPSGKPSAYADIAAGPGSMRVPTESIRLIRQYTDAMVHLIDRAVGRITGQLRESGLWDDTLLVFTSDHGDFLGDMGLAYKYSVADRTLNHVPLIVKPHRSMAVSPGRRGRVVGHTDLLPTLCAAAGVARPELCHGSDLLGPTPDGRSVLIQNYGPNPRITNFSLCDDRYRLTWYPQTDERELYDHQADPTERRNLAGRGLAVERELFGRLLEAGARLDVRLSGRVCVW